MRVSMIKCIYFACFVYRFIDTFDLSRIFFAYLSAASYFLQIESNSGLVLLKKGGTEVLN